MGNTPWTSNDTENPSLWVSEDGSNWQTPPGVTNPLDIASGGIYNSDPELIWRDGVLYLVWRRVSGVLEGYLYRSSSDGINWSPTERFTTIADLSPCLAWKDDVLHMWGVAMNYRGPGEIYNSEMGRWHHALLHRTAPSLLGPWSAPVVCDIRNGLFGLTEKTDPWHMGVRLIDNVWHMIAGVGEVGWGGGGNKFVMMSSVNGNDWNVDDRAVMMTEPGTWQDVNMYRPSFLVEVDRVRVWYSARATSGANRTGYTEFPRSYLLSPPI